MGENEKKEGKEIRWLGHVGIILRAITGCAGVMEHKGFLRGQQASFLGHWSNKWTHPIPDAQEHSPHFCPIVWVGFLLSLFWRVFVYYPSGHDGAVPTFQEMTGDLLLKQ